MSKRKKFKVNFKRLLFSLLILALIIIAPVFGLKSFLQNNANEVGSSYKEPEKEIPKDTTISLVAIGDVMCHSQNYKTSYNSSEKTYDFSPAFVNVAKYISEGDISIRKS